MFFSSSFLNTYLGCRAFSASVIPVQFAKLKNGSFFVLLSSSVCKMFKVNKGTFSFLSLSLYKSQAICLNLMLWRHQGRKKENAITKFLQFALLSSRYFYLLSCLLRFTYLLEIKKDSVSRVHAKLSRTTSNLWPSTTFKPPTIRLC